MLPLLGHRRLVSVPTLYVIAGALLALTPFGPPVINPLADGGGSSLAQRLVTHTTELIVIISLAGAGLAVDRPAGRRAWSHTWALLLVVMPLSLVAIAAGGWALLGLPLASAALLAAALAPTDPVLARSVQVSAPTEGQEHDVQVSLTTEAGLNDGLAFPFVYLAIALAALPTAADPDGLAWLGKWFAWDLLYRVTAGVLIGWSSGHLLGRFLYSPWGDAQRGGSNAGLVLIAATFMIYGLTEAVDGYGFLAVFVGARAGRAFSRETGHDAYSRKPHFFSDQIEKILLALLLLWLGSACITGLLDGWRWSELAFAAGVLFVARPLAGVIGLLPTRGSRFDRLAIAAFGIRGLGSLFYLAYAQAKADFAHLDTVWRTTVLTILLSMLLHGVLAPLAMARLAHHRPDAAADAAD